MKLEFHRLEFHWCEHSKNKASSPCSLPKTEYFCKMVFYLFIFNLALLFFFFFFGYIWAFVLSRCFFFFLVVAYCYLWWAYVFAVMESEILSWGAPNCVKINSNLGSLPTKKGLIASIKTSHNWYCHHEYTVLATSKNLYDSKATIVLNMALFNTESIHWQLNDKSSGFTFVGGT